VPAVHFTQPDGERRTLDVPVDSSLMRAAVDAGVQGIVGECGGAAMCGTCHVLVDAEWLQRLPPMRRNEDELLDCTAEARQPHSRLGCQLRMSAALDGLSVHLPQRQR
jgi:2Fe-2S ferredoxin